MSMTFDCVSNSVSQKKEEENKQTKNCAGGKVTEICMAVSMEIV